MKATALAPSNIAFVKYWGKKDDALRLPENGSLSMNLSNLLTTTTVEFSPDYSDDRVEINGGSVPDSRSRAVAHLDRIRAMAGITDRAKVISKNTFPVGTGLSSSASGFAALTVAAAAAAGLRLSLRELSVLARQGSGSACRSIPDGFVEWLDGDTGDSSCAISLHPPDYWDIVDVVAVVSEGKKDVSSSAGQTLASTSPFFAARKDRMKEKMRRAKQLLAEKDFSAFGELIEAEALEMHAVMLTSRPALIYWTAGSLRLMKLTQRWRAEGLPVYFTINTGQDVHLICERTSLPSLHVALAGVEGVKEIVVNSPAAGTRIVSAHLF